MTVDLVRPVPAVVLPVALPSRLYADDSSARALKFTGWRQKLKKKNKRCLKRNEVLGRTFAVLDLGRFAVPFV